jgi:hypothetical protein
MAAVDEADEAARFFDQRQAGRGFEFLTDLQQALEKIRERPRHYPRYELCPVDSSRDVRRVRLVKFPYLVIYEVIGEVPVAVAVMHTSRRPDYWLPRLH